MNQEHGSQHPHDQTRDEGLRDPICGMEVSKDSAAGELEHGGRTYYFCSARCREKFRAAPAKYAARDRS